MVPPTSQIEITYSEIHKLGYAQAMPVGDREHCVVAHAVTLTSLCGPEKGDAAYRDN